MVCPNCGTDTPHPATVCETCRTPFPALSAPTSESETMPYGTGPMRTPGRAGGAGATGPLAAGAPFGARYRILRELGAGGMGVVYQAWDAELGVPIALKVVRPEVNADPQVAQEVERRFKRELLLARQVTHKHVVRIHDLGEIDGIKYITMPYIEGRDPAQVLRDRGQLPAPEALKFAKQIAAGLVAAHDAGVVHRDLKPENIMIDQDGHALIMDFGISRSVTAGTATATGAVMGTLEYMAPEQARGSSVDHRADLYSFGLIVHDMLPAMSPDGRQAVFAASTDDGRSRLWLRPLDSETARPLAGTENAIYPFWSPDNKSIGFFATGKLKKMNVSSGPATPLADAPTGRGGTWSRDGIIVFAPTVYDGLYQIPASGGSVRRATRFESGMLGQRFPWFLPDGRHFLYLSGAGGRDQQTIRIGSLDTPPDERTVLSNVDSSAVYVQGHLLFVRGTTLIARPFDETRLAATGEEIAVADHVLPAAPLQSWMFSASANGVLTYASGETPARTLTWRDRAGRDLGTVGDAGDFEAVRLSPDRNIAAVAVNDNAAGNADIWLYDLLRRGLRTRFTFGPAPHGSPVWSPNGSIIVFTSNRTGRFNIYRKPADGSRDEELLYTDDLLKDPTSFSPDGAYLAYNVTSDPKTGGDIWILPGPLGPAGAAKPYPFLRTTFNERDPQFSPDGHWIAYQSNESGRFEVYVRPFPGPGGMRQISTAGGVQPLWRADGTELFYRAPDDRLMAARVASQGSVFDVQRVQPLFGPIGLSYDVWTKPKVSGF
jgi:serine/threonine protein kinase